MHGTIFFTPCPRRSGWDCVKFLLNTTAEIRSKFIWHVDDVFFLLFWPVRLWSLHSYTNVVSYKGHSFPVWALDISPQCLYFATGSQDRTARLWNLEYTFPLRIFAGHLQDVDVSTNPCERSRQTFKFKNKCKNIWRSPRAWWTKSPSVTSYKSGQDGAILPARDYALCPARKRFFRSRSWLSKVYLINPLLIKLFLSRYLDIGLFIFCVPRLRLDP